MYTKVQEEGKRSTYVPESALFIEKFFNLYKNVVNWENVWVLCDAGNANKELIEDKYGVKHVDVYPPKVHHLLSPNDNNLHGICKKKWKSKRNFKDDVDRSLELMRLLSDVDSNTIKAFWEKNFLWNIRQEDFDKTIQDLASKGIYGKIRNTPYLLDCLAKFEAWYYSSNRSINSKIVEDSGLYCSLDGSYWNFS